MSGLHYAIMDPTGNITVLVTDPVPREKQPALARELMADPQIGGEQVGFLEKPEDPACRCRLQMMGGEFCGNATMSLAAYLARNELADGEETTVPLEVSGAEGALDCRIRREGDAFEGTVRMPEAKGCNQVRLLWNGREVPVTKVELDGITHLILKEEIADDAEAEKMLRAWAELCDDEAVGLLQWNDAEGRMRPLVLVKPTGTAVWETGCGSGSASVGVMKALESENAVTVTDVRQGGGTIRVTVSKNEKGPLTITITGKVRLVREGTIDIVNWADKSGDA